MNFAEGYITYFAAIGLIILGLWVIYKGKTDEGLALITFGIGFAGGRRALSKIPEQVAQDAKVVAKVVAKAKVEEECREDVVEKPDLSNLKK